MQAIAITDQSEPIQLIEVPKPELSDGTCLVKIKYAALNRRDQWIREGLYPGIKPGVILGSDGCGEVVEGPSEWLGKSVMINPNIGWGLDEKAQQSDYSILGLPHNGTLAEFVKVGVDRLIEKPAYLTEEQAAAIPLAAMTAYRASVTKGEIHAGKKVLISGAGGGVAQFAIAIAVKMGCEVYVTSGDAIKVEKSVELGATGGFSYKDETWSKQALQATGGFDVVIDGAGGTSLNDYLKVTKPGGKIVIYGGTTGKTPKFDIPRLFWSQIAVIGSTMGSDREFEQMVRFFEEHQVLPVIDQVYTYQDHVQAFDRFKERDHFGKIVIRF